MRRLPYRVKRVASTKSAANALRPQPFVLKIRSGNLLQNELLQLHGAHLFAHLAAGGLGGLGGLGGAICLSQISIQVLAERFHFSGRSLILILDQQD